MANISDTSKRATISTAIKNCHRIIFGIRFKNPALSDIYYTIAYVCFVLSIVTIIFNVLTLKIFYNRRKSIRPNEIIIAGLACTDVFTGIISFPAFGILNLSFAAKRENCQVALAAILCAHCGQLLTISTLTLASLDRYFAIFQPFSYNARSGKASIAIKSLLAVWLFCVIITLAGLVTPSFMPYRVVHLTQVVAIVPFSVILHIKAFLIVRRIDNQIHSQCETENTRGRRNNAKATRITATIISAMCFCYFPQLFGMIIRSLLKSDAANGIILSTMLLVMINSTINPVIYCFQLDSFRKDLWELFSRKQESNESENTTNASQQ